MSFQLSVNSCQLLIINFRQSEGSSNTMQDFKKLRVWEKSHELTLKIYQLTKPFPDNERYGLVSQIRRCAVSIPSNIAEGCGRGGKRELLQFLRIAFGSSCELEYQAFLSRGLGFIKDKEYGMLDLSISEVKKMLAGLIQKLQAAITDN
jgi:four helix bundle protein